MTSNPVIRCSMQTKALALSITLALGSSAWPTRTDAHLVSADVRIRPAEAASQATEAGGPGPASIPPRTPTRAPANVVITNCDDSGPGSLRDAVFNAVNGDIVDLSQLTCSTITITTGRINVRVEQITLYGPGASNLIIDGINSVNGVIAQFLSYESQLTIQGLTIANGRQVGSYINYGGCIASAGNVYIVDSVIRNCAVVGNKGSITSFGGGVTAANRLSLYASTVTGNLVLAINGDATGAGVQVYGGLIVLNSTLANNNVISYYGAAVGSAVRANGHQPVYIKDSTIDDNYAQIGAIWIDGGGSYTFIANSTISGNRARGTAGLVDYQPLTIWNSTIAFNKSTGAFAAGVYANNVVLHSSILADNTSNNSNIRPYDIGALSIVGDHNLITGAVPSIPGDTLTNCPNLGPLAANGGRTRTHAIAHNSPAIDTGYNYLGSRYDQRGYGFVRTFGASTDIGAFEWQGEADDRLFLGEFENRCQ